MHASYLVTTGFDPATTLLTAPRRPSARLSLLPAGLHLRPSLTAPLADVDRRLPTRAFGALMMLAQPTLVSTRGALDRDLAQIRALNASVFGPGRFARTAYRIREGTPELSPFCRVAEAGGVVIASLRMTDVDVGGHPGNLLLGPLAVRSDFANQGHGRRLIAESLEAARTSGRTLVLLVGDLPYYGRLGFVPVPPAQINLPGPVDPSRLLALELVPGALDTAKGLVLGSRQRS